MESENIDKELAELEAALEQEENLQKEKEQKDLKSEPDIYPDFIENKYHNMERMVCLGVLEKEKSICFKIINYKKKIGKDYSYLEIKRKGIHQKIRSITSLIEKGTWNLNFYKSKLKGQLDDEEKLLASIEKEYNLTKNQKQILKDRINERINILNGELNQADEQEKKNKEVDIDKESQELNDFFHDYEDNTNNIDKYPNTAEDIYIII